MKKFKFICKGILLYVTSFITMLWLCGIDSITEQGLFIPWTLVVGILIYTCYKCISYREFYILSLSKWANNLK